MTLLKLCLVFFYIGLFTIGGGQVAITLMQQELIERGLITSEKFFSMIAISESTPGPIGINMATYIGYELYGVIGGILATFSTVLPSLIVIFIITKFVFYFQNNNFIKSSFSYIRPVVAGLIGVACFNVVVLAVFNYSKMQGVIFSFEILYLLKQVPVFLFFIFGIIFLLKTKLPPAILILIGAVFGVIFL
ncbi:MAG: chromate transporter [Treponemataceae bacterium]